MATVLTLDPLLQGLGPIAKALGWFPGMNHVCRSWASEAGNVTKIVVARSGDAYADPGDTLRCKPWWMPGGSIHCNYRDVDLAAPPRTFTRVGNVTFDVVP